jgi:cholesterol transport system auxiliary component
LNARRGSALAVLLVGLAGSAGCTGLFHSNAAPEQLYYLRAPAPTTAANSAAPLPANAPGIRVLTPLASPGLDSTHIMLVQADHRMSFFTASRWPSTAPEVVESLVVQTLRASGAWSAVMDSGSPFPADYLLRVSVRRFEADYTQGSPPTVQVQFDCSVGRRAGRDLLASFSVAGSATASADRMSEVLAAFEQAAGTALDSLSQQTLAIVRADPQQRTEAQPHATSER